MRGDLPGDEDRRRRAPLHLLLHRLGRPLHQRAGGARATRSTCRRWSRPGQAADFSAFALDEDNVFIDALKPAEDRSGDLILRLYEAKKADTECVLAVNLPVKAVHACNMLENRQGQLP